MRVGVLIEVFRDTDVDAKFAELRSMGMESCQLVCWDKEIMDRETADKVNEAADITKWRSPHSGVDGTDRRCGIFMTGRLPWGWCRKHFALKE